MTLIVRLRDEADRDLTDAASWYEQQRVGLGHEFLDDAQLLFDRIGEEPLNFPVVYRNARRAVMNRFPFCVYFVANQTEAAVVAVIHGTRHPLHWKGRTSGAPWTLI
jgi:plasmid stabilization system protein ParE